MDSKFDITPGNIYDYNAGMPYGRRAQSSIYFAAGKRFCDIVMALVATVVFSPFIIIVALCIWLEDRHSPIFRQERIGLGGKAFTLYKFRSMIVDAEANDDGDLEPHLCEKNDSRLTHIGRFLREHHLDEFPQLWNVLRGDMSFVGPRPERRFFIRQIMEVAPEYNRLYVLRPGLFSHATLHNGYTDTIEKMIIRLRMDLEYLDKISFATDIRIIYDTAMSILRGKKF